MAERRRVTSAFEGAPFTIELDARGRAAMENAGKRLSRGGARDSRRASVLKMQSKGSQTEVTVLNGVGVVATADEVVYVEPKIEATHFRYIIDGGKPAFRHDTAPTDVDRGNDWRAVLAQWYLDELRRVIEYGLPYDYGTRREHGGSLRGRIALAETLQMAAAGKPERLVFDVESLDADNPTTRLLLLALRHARVYDTERADGLAAAFSDEVGPLRVGDLDAVPTIDPAVTAQARTLAVALISARGIRLAGGRIPATAFFVPTPNLIEDGLRRLLVRNGVNVRKTNIALPADMGDVRLDLLLQSAVGDVKYKVFESRERWERDDVYQVVAFAAALRFRVAFLIGFSQSERHPDTIQFGDIVVHRLMWNLAEADPCVAGAQFVDWVKSITRSSLLTS